MFDKQVTALNHYDLLIDEDNDPVHDPEPLQEYMNKWDGPAFIEQMQLDNNKSVLEIGVGTGRLAVRVAPSCGMFYGVDISPKTIERATKNLAGFANVSLTCADFLTCGFDHTFDVVYILRHRHHFISVMEHSLQLESAEKLQVSCKQLERKERRIAELKRLFIKVYEDNARGKLSDERFDMLSQSYETEQKQLEAEVIALRQEIEVQERQNENIEKFIRQADKYVGIEEIDPAMLRELIQAIYVEAPDKSSGKRRQNIHIKYDGIGFIPLDELMKHE